MSFSVISARPKGGRSIHRNFRENTRLLEHAVPTFTCNGYLTCDWHVKKSDQCGHHQHLDNVRALLSKLLR